MTRWQLLCVMEVIGIGLAWWLLGRSPAPGNEEFGLPSIAAPAVVSAKPLNAPSSASSATVESEPAEPSSTPPMASAPPVSSGLVNLIGLVRDEAGAPVDEPNVTILRAGEAPEYYSCNPGESYFLLADQTPGNLELEIAAAGFTPWRGTVTLADQPPMQRRTFPLKRAWRVLVQVRTADGEDFVAKMSKRLTVPSFAVRVHVSVDRQPQTADLGARDWRRSRNDFAEFITSQLIDPTVPKNCVGVLDLAADPPLVASAWLGRSYLGSAPIESGAREIVIVADEEAFVSRLASLVVRVVDMDSGAPIAGASVKVSPPWTSGGATQTSDSAGRVQLSNLVSQVYNLEVSCEGYASTFREVIPEPGALLDFGDVRIGRPGEITGIVLDQEGNPVPNLHFSVFPTGAWTRPEGPRPYGARTDGEGRIRVQAGPERYQIVVSGAEFGLQAEEWPRGGAETEARTVRVRRGAEVLLSFTGEKKADRQVWLLDSAGRMLHAGASAAYSPWKLRLAAGPYLLRVEDPQRNLIATVDLRIPEGGGPVSVEIP